MTNMDKRAGLMYFQGLREGVTRYAHWKNGVQYVGTTGRSLQDALSEIDADESRWAVSMTDE